MTYAIAALHGRLPQSFFEITKLTQSAADLKQSVMGDDRNTRRVITTIFEPL
jgi:hypothetical protein